MSTPSDKDLPQRKVALLVTCLVDQLAPEVGIATVRLLRRRGVQVEFPHLQTCCGQAAWNSGLADEARVLAERTIEIFEPYDAVVAPSGSCMGMLHHGYEQIFRDDEVWLARARALATKSFELSQYLVRVLGVPAAEAQASQPTQTVTYHPSCHATRILGVADEPVQVLRALGALQLVPLSRAEDCCGFGGTFCAKLADLSSAIVATKVEHIAATGAQCVVSTDAGCLLNIRSACEHRGLPVQVLHLAQVVDREDAAQR